jgi:hypothetical protein
MLLAAEILFGGVDVLPLVSTSFWHKFILHNPVFEARLPFKRVFLFESKIVTSLILNNT